MAATNRYLAAGTLGVTSLLHFACLPFAGTFGGGLATSVFGAAMVGGLADWFAVSALFRKPLGIPWRTAVIPRNRERLFAMIAQMVQEELLSKENIKHKIEDLDIAQIVLTYFDDRGGTKTAKRMVHKLISDVLSEVDPQEAGRFLARFVRQDAGIIRLSPLLRSIADWTIQTGYDQKLISFAAEELANTAAKPEFRALAEAFLAKVLASYEADRRRRKLFNSVAGVSPERLALLAQQRLVKWLSAVSQQMDHPLRAVLRQKVSHYVEQFRQNPEREQELEQWKNTLLADLDISDLLQKFLHWLQRQAQARQQTARWFRQADQAVDQFLDALRTSSDRQQMISLAIKQALLDAVDLHHAKISALVYERLSQFSDEELVAFIEAKVGEDLQIIRVNGSVIGGVTGGLLYCLTFWL